MPESKGPLLIQCRLLRTLDIPEALYSASLDKETTKLFLSYKFQWLVRGHNHRLVSMKMDRVEKLDNRNQGVVAVVAPLRPRVAINHQVVGVVRVLRALAEEDLEVDKTLSFEILGSVWS